MTDTITALIAEARDSQDDPNIGLCNPAFPIGPHGHEKTLIERLADALEATVKEMHARELHHFEAERAMTEALAACDKVLAVKVAESSKADAAAAGIAAGIRSILTRALNENGETDV